MKYKYPSLYKYCLLLLTIFLFLKHQKIIHPDKLLINSLIITVIVGVFDYVLIDDHPTLFQNASSHNINSKIEKFEELFGDIDDIETIDNEYSNDNDELFDD